MVVTRRFINLYRISTIIQFMVLTRAFFLPVDYGDKQDQEDPRMEYAVGDIFKAGLRSKS